MDSLARGHKAGERQQPQLPPSSRQDLRVGKACDKMEEHPELLKSLSCYRVRMWPRVWPCGTRGPRTRLSLTVS